MADLERTYIIPLRQHFRKAPRYKRSKRAINAIRSFLTRHMKAEQVKIGNELNEAIFKNGYRNPPSKINVTAKKELNIVKVNLQGVPYKEPIKPEEKKPAKEKLKEALFEKVKKPGEIKEEKPESKEEKEVKPKTTEKKEADKKDKPEEKTSSKK